MLTKDEQENQNADAQKDGVQNTNLDDVLPSKRVKIARKEKRLTQEELASLCDCTPTHICNIENGKLVSPWTCCSRSAFFWEKAWTTSLWTIPVLTRK